MSEARIYSADKDIKQGRRCNRNHSEQPVANLDLGEQDLVQIRWGRLARGRLKEAHREQVEGRGSVVPKEGTTHEPIIQKDTRVL